MENGLEHLLTEGVVSEVIARLKSGKEADVYAVRYGGAVVAAKVYKDRAQRSFKNNSAYKEGRTVRNSRSQRAVDKGSKFGKSAAEDAWKSAEVDALYKLHAAGVRVPAPVMFLEGVLLMELVLDAEGDAAPRVIDTQLTVEQANAAYHDMLAQLVRILSCDLIHGDLSPYNVLWAVGGPTIIDFPQIVSAAHNSSSETFFLRDAKNILGHFASIDRTLDARSGDAFEIWRAYMRRELTPEFLPTGRARAPEPRPRAAEQASQRGQVYQGARPQQHGGANRDGRPHQQGGPGRDGRPPQQGGPVRDARPQQHGGPARDARPQQQVGGGRDARQPQQRGGHAGGRPQHQGGPGGQPPRAQGPHGAPQPPHDRGARNPPHDQRARPDAGRAGPPGGQRRPPRAPEVIVLTHRSTQPAAPTRPAEDRPVATSHDDTTATPARRRRRGRR